MKRMPAVNWRLILNTLAAIAALVVLGLGGCELSVAEGPGDTTAGDAASGTAAPDVADDLEAALRPTPTVVAALSPTPTAVAALSPTPTVGSTEGINGFGGTPCNPGPLPWLEGWFWDNAVRWRDDGSTILFSQGPVVYAAEADGSRVRTVADASTTVEHGGFTIVGEMTSFDVSPQGDEIVYATCAYQKEGEEWLTDRQKELAALGAASSYEYEIAAVGLEGTQPRRLTENKHFDNYPSWSPDGERIAFATVDGDELALYTMAADGTEARRVPVAAGWEPRYRGGHDVLVEYVEHENYGVEWEWITTLEWSPTGDRLLYGCAWSTWTGRWWANRRSGWRAGAWRRGRRTVRGSRSDSV